ncbi:MAG: hypothetical protein JWR35_2672 [Marmoricola sp.]|nr:hypothetical protein [Marmoricola sp.]
MIIKLLLVGGALGAAILILREQFPGQRQARRRIAGLAVLAAGAFAVIWPEALTHVANAVGVGRGTDLVLYVLVMVFLFTTVATYQRLHHMESRIATLARELALRDAEAQDRTNE